jgi:hypothetical protein
MYILIPCILSYYTPSCNSKQEILFIKNSFIKPIEGNSVDIKGGEVIKSRNSKKDRQHNGQKKEKKANNHLQNTTEKTKIKPI